MASTEELRVADLMTRSVSTLTPTQSLPLAEALMGLERIRHIPVVDDAGRLVGLVTHRDLLSARISALAPLSDDERSSLELSIPVSKIMRTDVWTIAPDALAASAARILRDHRFGCLPVIEDGKLVGILTEADLLALVTTSLEAQRSRPLTAAHAMTPSPVTMTSATTIPEARSLMERYGIRHLPVLDDGRFITLVSERDLAIAEVVFRHAAHPSATRAARLVGRDDALRVRHDAPLDRVFRDMFEAHIDVALVEDGARLVGILSALDACRLLGEHQR
jgi:CBS domain-containing membrane protein